MVRFLFTIAALAIGLFVFAWPGLADEPPRAGAATAASLEAERSRRAAILRCMTTNSDQRCVGISLVVEALLDGSPVDGGQCCEARDVAERIYASLTDNQRIRYERCVLVEGRQLQSVSDSAIDRISSLVADMYKRDFARLMTTEAGRRKLLVAEDSVVATSAELDRLLAADPDNIDAFYGTGLRRFPDGTVEDTNHAFLIGKRAGGGLLVYDANDPGAPIEAKLFSGRPGVAIEWTCRYRDTGLTTTQHYLIVPKGRFFEVMLGE